MSLKLKIALFIMFLFFAAIGNALFTFLLEGYSDEKLKWVNHAHEVIIETHVYLGAMKDTETGQRGFLLTQNINYLEPYHRGVIDATISFNRLKELTADNAVQQSRLNKIRELMQLKLDELQQTINLVNEHKVEKALEIVKKNVGKKYMDDIRIELDKFINSEILLLEQRKGDFNQAKAKITTLIIVEILFFIFLAFLAYLFFNKNLFEPLKILLLSTKKTEKGEIVDISDITSRDEMGYLISSVVKMNHIVNNRTEVLEHRAHHDQLTGLKNRSVLYESLQNAMLGAEKTQLKIALFFIDLDKFKQLNDSMGHDAGDLLLKETAQRLDKITRAEDDIFRIGGDEFIVIIKDIASKKEIEKIIKNIISVFDKEMLIQNQSVKIRISLGAAIFPDDSDNIEELLKMADLAMYEAKKDPKQCFRFFDKKMLKRNSDKSL